MKTIHHGRPPAEVKVEHQTIAPKEEEVKMALVKVKVLKLTYLNNRIVKVGEEVTVNKDDSRNWKRAQSAINAGLVKVIKEEKD